MILLFIISKLVIVYLIMENIFINLIKNGKIHNPDELKKAFRKIAKKTHPDIVGSDQFVQKFIQFKKNYEDAKQYLKLIHSIPEENVTTSEKNFRFLFFQELKKLDTLELPRNKNKKIEDKINATKESLSNYFKKWRENYFELFLSANNEYQQIKDEKPKYNLENLRKPSLYKNLRPVFFNLSNYHITGLEFYKKQLKRNLNSIIERLEKNNFFALKKFLLFLIEDMENGPAVLE